METSQIYNPMRNPSRPVQSQRQAQTIRQEDASGWQKFSYGKLGELTKNIRTFALPFENQTYTFAMQYKYDSWNRIQEMTYPDGERVRYGYNLGGMLCRVAGQKDGRSYHYIDSIHYNRFELKDGVWYGNGTRVSYTYDSLLRLSRLQSACADGAMQDIAYTYDSVGNILRIENGAGTLSNGLGNPYYNQYTYDDLYRLTGANGWWYGEVMSYQMQMEYHPNGRIRRKQLNALSYEQTGTSSSMQTILYDNFYHYNNLQPNTLSFIGDSEQQFGWDASGNMTRHVRGDSERRLCWDEQNRLLGVLDEGRQLSCYLYDANGDRTYKFTGEYTAQNQSGQWHYYYLVDQPTLYASPYLVANRKGYTKHYYAESERIASRIGGGGLQEIGRDKKEHMELFLSHQGRLGDLFETLASCLDAEVRTAEDALKVLYDWHDSVHEEKECYWYHPDHLGSSSWITFTDGKAVQHLHYLPWGEDYVNQRTTDFSARYTFSAKEKDSETGLSYFGSRYYSSDLSIWLSVDPMSDKYPSLSPYVYCADNPVRVVDPDGEKIWIVGEDGSRIKYVQGMTYDGQDKSISQKVNVLNQMNSTNNGKKLLEKLTSSGNSYDITDNTASDYNTENAHFNANDKTNGKAGGVIVTKGKNDLGTISHELFHAYQDEEGQGGRSIHNEVEAMLFQTSVVSNYYWNKGTAFPSCPLLGDNDAYNMFIEALLEGFSTNKMESAIKGFKNDSGANRGDTYKNYVHQRPNQSKDLIQDFYPLLPWKK